MAFKGWFGGGKKGSGRKNGEADGYSIDDLIVLERYDDAADRLRAKLKTSPQDLHSHLKLAEVYTQLQQLDRAIDEFGFVADEYAQDGFYDKGIALLSKAQRLAPADASLRGKIEKLQREKSMEHVRTLAIEGLRQAGGQQAGTSALELQRLWHNLAATSLVQKVPGEQLKRLFSMMQLERFEPGVQVAAEGSREAFLLIVARGLVEASVTDASGRKVSVREFGAGAVLGEAALLERSVWPADYVVEEAVTALKLTREGLEQTLMGNPDPKGFLE
ncbi:MAG TPA: cyclic nucleotide-binding domain-containing protein, partial [Thermoanaerobaculia bacterium]